MATISSFAHQTVLFNVLLLLCHGADSRHYKSQTFRRISEQMCHKYAEYRSEPKPDKDLSLSLLDGDSVCTNVTQIYLDIFFEGKQGKMPGLMKYPHMALIGYNDSTATGGIHWGCGGSLISEDYILTTARCLQDPMAYVLLGELDLDSDDDLAAPTIFGISKEIIHPNYNQNYLYNDIALLKLNRTIQFDEFIRPACLHQTHDIVAKEAVATGWGEDADGRKNSHLQEVELELISLENCTQSFRELNLTSLPRGIDDECHLCAGSYTSGQDTCAGDGGGPLQVYHPTYKCMFDLVGITSFGFPHCGSMQPGVYTRISHYLKWIEDIVWPEHQIRDDDKPRQIDKCFFLNLYCLLAG